MKLKSLSDADIANIATSFSIDLIGIFMRDSLPKQIRANSFYIFNLDGLHDPKPLGTHWVALRCDNASVIYFDSFGCPPPIEIQQFIGTRFTSFGYNNWQIQDLASDACGYYCLAFGATCGGTANLESAANSFINCFGDNTKDNDAILTKFFN